MKKFLLLGACVLSTFFLTSCAEEAVGSVASGSVLSTYDANDPDSIYKDLSPLTSTMLYGEVFNMMSYPDEYLGKNIQIKGLLNSYQDEISHEKYFWLMIPDAAACCSQGFGLYFKEEYDLDDIMALEPETEVTLVGRVALDEFAASFGIVSYYLEDVYFVE